jgi:hypothetical protein
VVALGALGFAAMMAHIATGEVEPGGYEPVSRACSAGALDSV